MSLQGSEGKEGGGKERREGERGEAVRVLTLREKAGSCGTASVRHLSRNCRARLEVITVVRESPNIC